MNARKIKDFKACVMEQLSKQYNMDEFSARKAVRDSYLEIALKIDADEAMHNPVEYWVDYVHNEFFNEELKQM